MIMMLTNYNSIFLFKVPKLPFIMIEEKRTIGGRRMERAKRIFLYFFIMVLFLGWLTSPLMEKLLSMGIIGVLGAGTLVLINYIYNSAEKETHGSRTLEFIVACGLFIMFFLVFWYLFFI